MKKYLFITIIFLLIGIAGLYKMYSNVKADRNRLQNNQSELLLQSDYYRSLSSENAENVRQLELTVSELKIGRASLVEKIEKQGIKIRYLLSTTSTNFEAKAEIKTVLRDSVVIRDSISVVVQNINWSDGYFSLKGQIKDKILTGSGTYRDTLIQSLYRVPYRFLFVKWGCKEVRQVAKFANPNAKIKYQEVIKIRKRKGG